MHLSQPFITVDELRRELPPHEADYCIRRMEKFRDPSAPNNAYDYVAFSQIFFTQ